MGLTIFYLYARFFHVPPIERINMQVSIPQSSTIKKADYMGNTLTLEFARGGVYQYDEVPAVIVAGLTLTDSAGSFFSRFIKNKYRVTKLTN